jgi:anti-sigma factor RsiW
MTCRELNDFLLDYLEGALPESVRAAFEEHLGLCEECVVYLEEYREVVRLGRACGEEHDAAEEAPEELVRAILAARS